MTREEVLNWYADYRDDRPDVRTHFEDAVECYEALLARCLPWLEDCRQVVAAASKDMTHGKLQWRLPERLAELDALIGEIKEGK